MRCSDCSGAGSLQDFPPYGDPPAVETCPTCEGRGEFTACERCEEDPVLERDGRFCALCLEVIHEEDRVAHEEAHR